MLHTSIPHINLIVFVGLGMQCEHKYAWNVYLYTAAKIKVYLILLHSTLEGSERERDRLHGRKTGQPACW